MGLLNLISSPPLLLILSTILPVDSAHLFVPYHRSLTSCYCVLTYDPVLGVSYGGHKTSMAI